MIGRFETWSLKPSKRGEEFERIARSVAGVMVSVLTWGALKVVWKYAIKGG